uniref:F-box domain-containing protein n=1 Tax=Steinernema glaseri TaxID=37863 RepID=A0A1I7ZEW8_9BILA
MNSVPAAFLEALLPHIANCDLQKLQGLRSRWSSKAATYRGRRRYLSISLKANREGSQVSISVETGAGFCGTVVPFAIDPKYDWIRKIVFKPVSAPGDFPEKVSMQCFRTKILPLLQSSSSQCSLFVSRGGPFDQKLTDEFIKQLVAAGQVDKLFLGGEDGWSDILRDSANSLLKSPKFWALDLSQSNITLEFNMVTCFIERFFKGDLRATAYLSGRPSFPLAKLKGFRPQNLIDKSEPEGAMFWTENDQEVLVVDNSNGLITCRVEFQW